ncbi:MAG: aminopeptidase [archaeon GB-1867-005]|nr:aminopeptidase [Candidatus Culexmicrobium cathedralense]
MVDERLRKVAEILVDYSTEIKEGDRVLIHAGLEAKDLALEIYRLSILRGAHPWIKIDLPLADYIFYKYATDNQINWFPEHEYYEIQHTDVYFAIRAPTNLRELINIDPGRISARLKVLRPIRDWRVEKTRWVVFYYPTNALAQEAEMSFEEFEDFVFNACLVDWRAMSEKMQKIKELLDSTDEVKIVSDDTELEFSIKGRNALVADGKRNMPDGEVYTSVVEDSVNGYIRFDVPAVRLGNVVEDITLKFENGAVVEAKATKNQKFLKKMLDTDEGAKRIGEFGIGLNYNITRPVKNILFDEKIGGTIHLALGRGYKATLSKNESAIHWDMIKDLRKGGEIYFDGKLVMKDGKWLIFGE